MNTFERIVDIAALYRTKKLSPVEVVETFLAQIEQLNPTINAFITVTSEAALEDARRAEAELSKGYDRGPMHGIPVALKDLIETEGVRTTCGSRLRTHHVSSTDATIVRRLKASGAIVLGKTNLLEFAYGVVHPDFGPTLNPWDTARTAGGSSGGSAAAVAAGLCCAAVGTDTGGSIRIPASYCGVVGLKPSYGLVDLEGIFPLAWSLDHAGPIARNCRDAATLLEALTGHAFPLGTGLGGLRCGIDPAYLERIEVQPVVLEAFQAACDVFRSAGATIVEVEVSELEQANNALLDLLLPEATLIHEENLARHEESYAPATYEQLKQGLTVPATTYVRALRFQQTLQGRFDEHFGALDALLMPTAPWIAPSEDPSVTGDEGAAEMHFTGPFNLLGLPALSIPCGPSHSLPIGLQIVAGPQRDAHVLSIGVAFETFLPPSIPDVAKIYNS